MSLVLFFGLVALIIDRRAFLVSSLAYLGGAMVYALHATAAARRMRPGSPWSVLGAAVILLGVGWQKARGFVMRFVPDTVARYRPCSLEPEEYQ